MVHWQKLTVSSPVNRRAQRVTLPLVILLLLALTGAVTPATSEVAGFGENAVFFTGMRPASNPDDFDLSGYIEVPYSPALNPMQGAITIEAWIKRSEVMRNETIVGNGWQTSYWFGFSSAGRLRFIPHGLGSGSDGEAVVPAGVWTHVAVTYDGVTRRFFINGVLDKSSSVNPGPLAPAPNGEPLGIGFDRDDSFMPNYFAGGIDNVRIWHTVRNADEIRDSMFLTLGAAHPGLRAEWHLNGSAEDPVGGHDGSVKGYAIFSNEGAIPHDIRIPQVNAAPTVDGNCSSAEYGNATEVTVDGASVKLLHTADDLWICFDRLHDNNARAMVFLDVPYSRQDPAQSEHLLLQVHNDDTTTALQGAGDNTYGSTTVANGLWEGDYNVCCGEFPTRRAEFRIAADLLGGWDHVIGLALGQIGSGRALPDLWPALAVSYLPSTWSSATLGGIGPERTFTGSVRYQPRDSSANLTGVPGVTVKLIGSDPGGGEALVATAQSNVNGSYSLTTHDDYAVHRIELGAPPQGLMASEAEAPAPAEVIDSRTIHYGAAPGGVYPNNRFLLADAKPSVPYSFYGPYFLIIAPEAIIDSGALDEFADFKRRLGFAVEVASLEMIDATQSGGNRRDRIRAFEQGRLNTIGTRFRYVMLVGSNDVIPVGYSAIAFTGHGQDEDGESEVDLTACLAPPKTSNHNTEGLKIKFTEWYYADLTSDLDSNGNGCILDGLIGEEEDFAPGYTPDARPTLRATVAVGRIPLDTETAVRTALTNSIRFEQQAPDFKLRTLQAMSNVFLKGQYWSPKDDLDGTYQPCSGSATDKPNKNCKTATTDGAAVGEFARSDYLNPGGYNTTILYEPTKPEGAVTTLSPQPLTAQNVLDKLQQRSFGLVGIGGHGSQSGVSRTYWQNANNSPTVDSPTEPLPFQSVDEIKGATLLKTSGLDDLTPDNENGAIYIVSACSTGHPLKPDNFGATLLSGGHGVGWVGGLSMVNATVWTKPGRGGMAEMQYRTMENLIEHNMLLGDALWRAMERQGGDNVADESSGLATALYGDPSLSYWGNPGGQATLAPWPMLRHDPMGLGYNPLIGPESPSQMWSYNASAPGTNTVPPSPVISNIGEVIVAHGSYVDVLRDGELYQRLKLDAPAWGTPAVAADGTIYALDNSGKLYAFRYLTFRWYGMIFASHVRFERWTYSTGYTPRTSPVIGADGYIAFAYGPPSQIAIVRPDGRQWRLLELEGNAVDALVWSPDRKLFVATRAGSVGRLYKWDVYCYGTGLPCDDLLTPVPTAANSTPPLLAYNAIYLGRQNGEIVKLSSGNMNELASFQADGPITAGPVAGPSNQILVGTQNGTIYSLTADLSLRWQRNIGAPVNSVPAFSASALYIVSNNALHAYNPFSGAPLWSRSLGAGTGNGSVAVGFGRELYVQSTGGKVVAYNDGWRSRPLLIVASPVLVAQGATAQTKAIRIEYQLTAPPPDAGGALLTAAGLGENAIGVLLQRSADSGEWEDVAVLPVDSAVYTDTAVMEDTNYSYRVKILDSEGDDSDYVVTHGSVKSLPAPPGAPELLTVTAIATDTLHLEWSPPVASKVDAYRVERSASQNGPFETVLEVSGQATEADDAGLAEATSYFYRVIAVNGGGVSVPSGALSATTRKQTLPPPENVTATLLDNGQTRVSWDAPSGGVTAVIEYIEGALDSYEPLGTSDAAGPYHHTATEPSSYIYRVKFVDGNAESPWAYSYVLEIEEPLLLFLPMTAR